MKNVSNMAKTLPHSVVVLFNKNHQILLEERADDGYFDFPGGGLEKDEDPIDGAKRELFEETGLIADELRLFKIYTGKITHYVYFNGDEIYGIDHIYICKKYHGNLSPQLSEVKALNFYDFNKLPDKMSIRNKQIIKDLLINGD